MMRKMAVVASSLLFLAARPAPAPPEQPAPEKDIVKEVMIFRSGGSRLGVSIDDISADRAKELKLKEETGVEIKSVLPDSPAAEAGLEEGDVILEYQGTRVESAAQLVRMVRETPPGRTVTLLVSRDGSTRTVRAKVEEREDEHRKFIRGHRIEIPHIEIPEIEIPDIPGLGSIPSSVRLGAQVENLTDQLGEYFGVKDGQGVLVQSVRKGAPGEAAGLRAGDVIIRVDDEEVSDSSDLRSALRERRGKQLKLTIVRDRREQTLTVAAPRDDETSGASRERARKEAYDRARALSDMEREKGRLRREMEKMKEEMQTIEIEATAAQDEFEDAIDEEEDTPAPPDEDKVEPSDEAHGLCRGRASLA
ncbi:MAG: PDZ domain-containing protein [Acidobacteria bacterium]|nr:PDZ domain-containing protein [Acidobacteriota bacterium]